MAPTVVVLPPQSYVGWKVSISLLHALSASCTIYRLVHRFRIHRTWWDDHLILIPLVSNVLYCVLTWIRFNHRGTFEHTSAASPWLILTLHAVVNPILGSSMYQILNSYWLSLLPYLLSVWTARIVLALSLGRIFPDKHPARRWSYLLVIFLGISFIICALTPALACRYLSSLMILYEATYCATINGKFLVSIVVLVADSMVCDILLFLSPLALFWRVKLPPLERRLVLVFFCGSVLTLLTGILFAAFFLNRRIYTGEDYLLILVGLFNIDAAVSLFASNLIVISTCLYQALRRLRNREIYDLERAREITPHTSALRSRPCSCVRQSDHSPSPEHLTLTEISTYGSSPPRSHDERPSHIPDDISIPWIPDKSELTP